MLKEEEYYWNYNVHVIIRVVQINKIWHKTDITSNEQLFLNEQYYDYKDMRNNL